MITNIVCHTDLGCSINLKDLTSKCVNIIYDPSKFPAAIWKHKTIGGTCMVFSNGKLMINGKINSIREAKQRMRRYARLLQKIGWHVTLKRIVISTISAFYKLDGPLDVYGLAQHFGGSYEAQWFPAVMFVKNTIHFTCFHTGAVLMTGIKTEKQFYDTIIPTLLEMYLL